MKGKNEISPELLRQAQLLGEGRRMPTQKEIEEMERKQFLQSYLSVAVNVASALREGGKAYDIKKIDFITREIFVAAEELDNDYDDDVALRKGRNQIAAQLIYSELKNEGKADVKNAYVMANKLIEVGSEFGDTMQKKFANNPNTA